MSVFYRTSIRIATGQVPEDIGSSSIGVIPILYREHVLKTNQDTNTISEFAAFNHFRIPIFKSEIEQILKRSSGSTYSHAERKLNLA